MRQVQSPNAASMEEEDPDAQGEKQWICYIFLLGGPFALLQRQRTCIYSSYIVKWERNEGTKGQVPPRIPKPFSEDPDAQREKQWICYIFLLGGSFALLRRQRTCIYSSYIVK